MIDLQAIVDDIAAEMAQAPDRGKVADYIPDLATVSPDQFGIAIITADGSYYAAGDADVPFSAQSITKVFSLTMALGTVGDALVRRVGVEPSGSAFNSIVQLETEGFDQVQRRVCRGAKAGDVASIWGNLRFEQDNIHDQ